MLVYGLAVLLIVGHPFMGKAKIPSKKRSNVTYMYFIFVKLPINAGKGPVK